ncbi:MAG: LPS export ABC transporter ATP-binding protein [Candidatus Aminicenantes bacterium]|nr:MAG: LPS export ABC transporter ATP-binding protein [Candidatus Aminicenantes bacterium 4484_214]RLE02941.1 MAG: LPS export ABC transporter ATP-binding protein [Candidatus Aminicenantes bacterium]HHF42785.1 LPS export ABC transporter ATP-binding protein [Candidatus Aminicenantes bacterium]
MKQKLEALGLEKSFHSRKVVDNVSLRVGQGEIVALLGPNGAGKTTTFSLIAGLLSVDKGKVFLGDNEITQLPMYLRARQGLALLPQEPSVFRKLTVAENIQVALNNSRHQGVFTLDSLLREFKLTSLAEAKAVSLSGGERRRLEIARALALAPEFILLDEPFTGVDPLAVSALQKILLDLKQKGLGILITDHSVRDAFAVADRIYVIDEGRILGTGSPQELAVSTLIKRKYLGEDFSLEEIPRGH